MIFVKNKDNTCYSSYWDPYFCFLDRNFDNM